MKTAGLVLDFYDDFTGDILKSVCPTADALPEAIKTAHILSPEERDVLRDDAFALILHDNGKQLRKFACVDEGNTVLSTIYFMENLHKLPEPAIKTAAARLAAFNEEFGLPVPDQVKLAAVTGMARKRNSDMTPAVVGDEADWAQRTNLLSVRGGADSGRVIPTANQMKTAAVVDVSGLEAAPVVMQKKIKQAAVGNRYALDSFSDVEDAIRYFDESWTAMRPEDRHEFAVKTAARAEELGLEIPVLMQRYGSTDYAPDVEAHLANRRAVAPQFSDVWDDLQEKRAMLEPEVFAGLLKEADELFGLNFDWGGAVADPYYATFGGKNETEKLAWAYEDADGTKLTLEQLKAIPSSEIEKNFAPDFAQAFAHDPAMIFDSMPADTKQVLARMARS